MPFNILDTMFSGFFRLQLVDLRLVLLDVQYRGHFKFYFYRLGDLCDVTRDVNVDLNMANFLISNYKLFLWLVLIIIIISHVF